MLCRTISSHLLQALSKGAIPSDSVSEILLRHGIKHKYAEEKAAKMKRARAVSKSKGRLFNKAQKLAAQKAAEAAAEKAKTEAETKKAAEQPKA